MTFQNQFSIINNTQNTFSVNFNQYLPASKRLANIVFGIVAPFSTAQILFKDGAFYQDGQKMKVITFSDAKTFLYGDLTLATNSDEKDKVFLHQNIRWFDTKTINITSNGFTYTDNLDIDPKSLWIKKVIKTFDKLPIGDKILVGALALYAGAVAASYLAPAAVASPLFVGVVALEISAAITILALIVG